MVTAMVKVLTVESYGKLIAVTANLNKRDSLSQVSMICSGNLYAMLGVIGIILSVTKDTANDAA